MEAMDHTSRVQLFFSANLTSVCHAFVTFWQLLGKSQGYG